jgi:hypothetical protein
VRDKSRRQDGRASTSVARRSRSGSLEPMTADECQRRSDEAKTLAAQTQDLWERETLLRIATQWQLIASHKAAKENKPTS